MISAGRKLVSRMNVDAEGREYGYAPHIQVHVGLWP